jgi:hypothetical protein
MKRIMAVLAALTCVTVSAAGCSHPSNPAIAPPVTIQSIAGTEVKKVTLRPEAAHRLGVETTRVRPAGHGEGVVPYSAVIYDSNGKPWVYVVPAALTYVREPVTVAEVKGTEATLSAGPHVGTPVVTVGVAELYGAEVGIGDEEVE